MTAWATIEPGSDPAQLAIGCSRAEYELAKQIPGCHLGQDGIWRTPLTWAAWVCLSAVWSSQPIEVHPALAAWAQAKWAEVEQMYADRWAMDAADDQIRSQLLELERPGVPPLTPVQRGAAQWLVKYRRKILGDPRGNGKTPPVIRALQILAQTGECAPALVVCSDSAPLAWQRKLALWAPELRTVVIAGSLKKRTEAIEQLARGEADVGMITWGNVRYHTQLAVYPGQALVRCTAHGGEDPKVTPGRCEAHPKDFQGFRVRTVVLDECQHGVKPEAKQTRAAWWLAHHAENVWATTGTLTVNDVGDLWPVLHAVEGPLAHPVRSRYLDLFAEKTYAWKDKRSGQTKGERVLGLRQDTAHWFYMIADPAIRRIPREAARPGQPQLLAPEFRYPAMQPKQADWYRAIMKEGLAEIDERTAETLMPEYGITRFARLCQLAVAMIRLEDGEDPDGFTQQNVRMVLPSNKADELLAFLDENPGQWIVPASSLQLVQLAQAKLKDAGVSFTEIIGGMNYQQKDAAAQAFQHGQARVIFCTSAGSESIDLHAAEGLCWLQPTPSFLVREQMSGRADREGRDPALGDVRQVFLIAPGTVEVRLYQLSLDKAEQHQLITRDARFLRWAMDVQPNETIPEESHDTDTDTAPAA